MKFVPKDPIDDKSAFFQIMAWCQTGAKPLSLEPNVDYRKTSGISHTKSQNLNVSCILLQLSSLKPFKPGVKLRMKM